VEEILKLGGTLKVEDARDASGTPSQALLIDQEEGADYRLLVDPKTKLLNGVEVVVDAEELMKDAPKKEKIEISQFGWYPGTITTEAPGQDAFAYEPPKEFTKVETFATKADERESLVEKMVGQPAPDFTLMVYDGPGKTRTLSKADLAGKVVMIDFWATWCGPCMVELPEVQKMVEEYAKKDKELLIVALSQDSRPSEPAAVRKLIEETLQEKKITLTGTPVGVVGHDPDGTVGNAFNVTGLPTVVILDGKGVVQSVHVGYNENVRKVLTSEIDTLLSGKSIAKPEPAEAAEGKGEEK
jgi:thiol-disulfide isomerase/thioredoxin